MQPPVEDLDELIVVTTRVGEDELLELRLPVGPIERPATDKLMDVLEIGFDNRGADLVDALEVAHETNRHPRSVPFHRVLDRLCLERSGEMPVSRTVTGLPRPWLLDLAELDTDRARDALPGHEVTLDTPVQVQHVVGTGHRIR